MVNLVLLSPLLQQYKFGQFLHIEANALSLELEDLHIDPEKYAVQLKNTSNAFNVHNNTNTTFTLIDNISTALNSTSNSHVRLVNGKQLGNFSLDVNTTVSLLNNNHNANAIQNTVYPINETRTKLNFKLGGGFKRKMSGNNKITSSTHILSIAHVKNSTNVPVAAQISPSSTSHTLLRTERLTMLPIDVQVEWQKIERERKINEEDKLMLRRQRKLIEEQQMELEQEKIKSV